MIVDRFENAEKYWHLSPRIEKAFRFLENTDLSALPQGRTDIEEDALFAMHQTYVTQTENEKKLEAHQKYIDIQYLINGKESMGYCSKKNLPVEAPYDTEGDIEFFKDSPEMSLHIEKGEFAIFFPGEAHKPGCHHPDSEDHRVEKIVIKIKASL